MYHLSSWLYIIWLYQVFVNLKLNTYWKDLIGGLILRKSDGCLQVFGDQYLKYACLYGVAVRGGLLLGCVFARSKEAAFNTVKILLFCNPTVGLCI